MLLAVTCRCSVAGDCETVTMSLLSGIRFGHSDQLPLVFKGAIMHTSRLWLTVWGFFLVLPQTGVCAEPVASARSSIKPYIDWLPPDTETLVVLKQPYRIPASPDRDSQSLDAAWHEMLLARVFRGAARSALVGKQVCLWIEGSCRFRLPHVPGVASDVSTTGWEQKYDGCHILVFADDTPLNSEELLDRLVLEHSDADAVASVRRHHVAGRTVVECVVPARDRTKSSRETPETTALVEAALSTHYWITSPEENVLLIATSREVLADTLGNIKRKDLSPPTLDAALTEWRHVTGDRSIWGMRHYSSPPGPRDLSDPRRLNQSCEGLVYDIDVSAGRARLAFVRCDTAAADAFRSGVKGYVHTGAEFRREEDGTLVAEIDWSDENDRIARKVKSSLAFWLLMHLGHAFVI